MNDGNSGNNYSITYVPTAATGVITAAPLTVTAQTDSRSYNGTTSSSVAPVLTGTQYDAVGTAATQTYDNKNVGTTHVLSATGLLMNDGNSGNNYSITYAPSAASGIITAAALTITAATNTRIYDGTVTAAATPTVSGLQPGDTVTGLAEVYANKHAGSGKTLAVASYSVNDGNGGNNYSVSTVNNTTGVINAAPLMVTAQSDSRGYNGTTSSAVAPVLTGTQYDTIGTAATQTYDNKNVGTTHVLSASGLVINDGNGGNNYAITYMPSAATGIITAAPLSVTAQSDSRGYNGTTSSSVAPVVTGTPYDPVGTATTQTYDNRNVGTTHVLSATGLVMNDGNSGNNYAITYVSSAATGVITGAPLTVIAQTDSRVYNGTTGSAVAPMLTGTQYDPVGLAATQAYDNKNVSTTHVLGASGLVMNDGNSGNNYAITYVPSAATGVITAVPLAITADGKARLQGAANPPLTATYSGFVASEGPANLSGALVLSTPAVVASPPGAYAITAGGHASTNYIIAYLDGVLTVIPSGGGGGRAGLSDAISFATQQASGASGPPAAPTNPIGPQGVPVLQVYQVDGTGIRLPPGLQR
jgi:hypothetical protein